MEVFGKRASKFPAISVLQGSDDDAQCNCIPCEQKGHWVPAYGYCQNCAEYLCKSCYKSHRKPAPCRTHVLLDSSKMPKSQKYQRSLSVAHDLVEPCSKHQGEIIKYYCHDHAFLGCSPCITINHRACKVDYIPDISENFVAYKEYANLLHSLKTLFNSCKEIAVTTKENKREIKKCQNAVREQIGSFKQHINHTLDKWEMELNQEIEQTFGKESTKVESVETECNEVSTEVQKMQNDIETLHKTSKLNELFVKVKKNENNLKKYAGLIDQMQEKNTVSDVTFEPNLAIERMLLEETSLGQLILQLDVGSECLSKSAKEEPYKHKEPATERKHESLDRQAGGQNTNTKKVSDKESISQKQQTIMTEVKGQKNSRANVDDNITATQSGKIKRYAELVDQMQEKNTVSDVTFEPNLAKERMLLEDTSLGQLIQQQYGGGRCLSTTAKEQPYKHLKEPVTERKHENLDRQADGQNTNTKKVSDKQCVSQKQQTVMTEVKGQKNRGADVYENITATQSSKINIKTEQDSKDCYIRGMTIISKDRLAIADNGNSSIKIVDTKQSRILSDMKLNSPPWDVVLLPADELAVTIPWNYMIQVLSISDQLSTKRQIKVKGNCYGLSYFNQNFVVTFSFPAKVEILTVQGDILMTLMNDQSFQLLNHVAVDDSKNLIYVSDSYYSSNRIACLSLNGEVTGIYEDSKLYSPRGLAVLEDGSLLVASESSKICLVSSDFITSRFLQKTVGLNRPESVALDREQKKLYVSSWNNNFLLICKLKW
ncbi:uncharacterized protein LOC123547219 [Mercenaria mercenaria]|uniref:uncharacterized protein LOC123547219 n=1 Tax=Mercenaria mercenaria TaxID=6596 RepID=UPI00234F599B|nr:uncharacterized protein LOC123547219 [Mercenaria mercenaria]